VQHREELAALNELEEEVEAVRVLVGREELEDERVLAEEHELLLVEDVGDLREGFPSRAGP